MMNKDNESYKTISEVAELLNLVNSKTGKISTHTLRFWEKEFKQIKPRVFAGNRRYYDEKTIQILKKIKFLLKDKGMTLKGAKKLLNEEKSELDVPSNNYINTKNNFKKRIKKISKLIKNLKDK